MKINWNLKSALVTRFGTQVEAAHQLKISEAKLSHILRGYATPSDLERKALEQSLGSNAVRSALRKTKGRGECD